MYLLTYANNKIRSKKMKKTVFILILCLIPTMIFATDFYLGPKAGLNLSKFYGDGVDDYTDLVDFYLGEGHDNATKAGLNIGVMSNFRFTEDMALQLEMLYSSTGGRLESDDGDTKIKQGGLEIPVLFKYYIQQFNLFAGLDFFLPMGDSEYEYDYTGYEETEDSDTADPNVGLVLGAGYDIPMGTGYLGFDGRIFLGLTDIDSDVEDVKERIISFNISYGFKLNP